MSLPCPCGAGVVPRDCPVCGVEPLSWPPVIDHADAAPVSHGALLMPPPPPPHQCAEHAAAAERVPPSHPVSRCDERPRGPMPRASNSFPYSNHYEYMPPAHPTPTRPEGGGSDAGAASVAVPMTMAAAVPAPERLCAWRLRPHRAAASNGAGRASADAVSGIVYVSDESAAITPVVPGSHTQL